MYATLPLTRLLSILVWPFATIFASIILVGGVPTSAIDWIRAIGIATGAWGLLLLVLAGWSSKWSPWRMLWWAFPPLNRWVFPDLNGTWTGKTSSNWPVIKSMLDAATGAAMLQESALATIALQDDDLMITIIASFFVFRLEAKLTSTGGKSHSLAARVCKDERRDAYELYYVYRQETPEPLSQDEGSHLGAATLDVHLREWRMNGHYWTKRRWRSGLNTAGLISVSRTAR